MLEDWVRDDNPVRVVDVFVDELDLGVLGFVRVEPRATGRPGYRPSVLLKLYIYGYLNRVQSSRRLEREAGRNVELMWLTGRLVPDHKTIADFRKDNGVAIRKVCAQFVALCRQLDLLADASVAIDGAKFKAVTAPLPRRVRVPLEPPPPHRNGLRRPARYCHAPCDASRVVAGYAMPSNARLTPIDDEPTPRRAQLTPLQDEPSPRATTLTAVHVNCD